MNMNANGLELKEIKSYSEPASISSIDVALRLFNSTGYVVAYLDYKVLIGKINNNKFEFYNSKNIYEKYIQRLRLFNEQKELLIWRGKNGLEGRLRLDDEGSEIFVVDACQVLWGTKKQELNNGWTKLSEDRGTELILPFKGLDVNDKEKRVFLKTRNYVDFHNKTQQATYIDCRFVKFVILKGC
jgi:CRISPR-associated protein (TIGR03984 family)